MIRRGPMHARRTLLTAGILALCAACSSSPKKSDPTPGPGPAERPSVNLNGKYDEAISEESGGNYRDAYTRFMEIQGVDPEFKDLNTRLEGYTELVTIQRDIEDLREDPPKLRATYHVDFGNILRKRGPFYRDQARVQYMTALSLDETSFDAHFALGNLLMEMGFYGEAIAHFSKAVELEGNNTTRTAKAHFNTAFLHRAAPESIEGVDRSKALPHARKAVEFSSGDAIEMRRLLRDTLADAGKTEEAKKVAEAICKLDTAGPADQAVLDAMNGGGATDKPAEKPMDKPAEKPMDKPADAPAEKPADAPAEKPADAPAEKPMDKPADAPAEKPADAPAEKPMDKAAEKPAEKSADEKPTSKPTE